MALNLFNKPAETTETPAVLDTTASEESDRTAPAPKEAKEDGFEKAIRTYLEAFGKMQPAFAAKYRSSSKTIRQCCDYIINEARKNFMLRSGKCITQCGSAEVIPVGEVHDWQYRQLYPPKPKVVAAHDKGYVVQFGYEYVSKMTSRRLFHNGYINCAKVYTTRPAAEKVAQRIRKGFPTITNEPKVIVVNKIDGKWKPAA